jgi:UPF0755 protein
MAALVAVPLLAGWYVLRQTGQVAAPPSQAAGLEDAAVAAYVQVRANDLKTPASADTTPVTFTVRAGETTADIAERLQRQGLIRDAELFRLAVRARGLSNRMEAGDYLLSGAMTPEEIMAALQHGRKALPKVTIPEGLRAEEIAAILDSYHVVDPNSFLKVVREGPPSQAGLKPVERLDIFAGRAAGSTSVEGFLFPETYEIAPDSGAETLVRRMLATFDERFTPDLRQKAKEKGLNVYQAVTLASIVEREAQVDSERGTIASVFLNRLAAGMTLDADPTVQYALGQQKGSQTWWKRPLLLSDLKVNSPYNTYTHKGLPPGPICNPGLSALRAVAEAPTTDHYYFVANDLAADGSHVFARTFEEHQRNVQKYSKLR